MDDVCVCRLCVWMKIYVFVKIFVCYMFALINNKAYDNFVCVCMYRILIGHVPVFFAFFFLNFDY